MSDEARPRTVAVAVLLLRIVGLGYLLDAGWLVFGAGSYVDQVRDALAASDTDPAAFDVLRPFATVEPYLAAGLVAVAGLVLLGLAASVRAGHVAGRILTWIAAGLALTCSVCAAGTAGTPGFSGMADLSAGSRDASGNLHQFGQRLPDGYPAAYRYLSGGFALAAMFALIVVIVLLARPSANRFFRPAAVVAVPVSMQPRPVPPAPVAVRSRADIQAELSTVERRHQRGDITAEEYTAERRRLLGSEGQPDS